MRRIQYNEGHQMVAQTLYLLGCLPLILLGTLHLIFTLKDHKKPQHIVPRSENMIKEMRAEPLRLTRETSMWRAWIGFNISHSMAILLVGLGYMYLSARYFTFLREDILILWAAPVLAWIFVILSKCFWFSKPLKGSLISAALFTLGAIFA